MDHLIHKALSKIKFSVKPLRAMSVIMTTTNAFQVFLSLFMTPKLVKSARAMSFLVASSNVL